VKKLVQAIGGQIDCESRPGEGATFVLRLPAFKAVAVAREPTATAPA
jgi:signal transduction histidine kinase